MHLRTGLKDCTGQPKCNFMKKIILVCALLLGGGVITTVPVFASQSPVSASRELPADARPITVYKVVQVGGNSWSNNPKSAYYSASENCIYVNEGKRKNQPYTVNKNPAYGQSNDGRASYHYTAGGYYFDL